MSFKWKTILGIAAIELFFLSFLVWQAARFIQGLGETEIEKRADDTVMLADTVLLDSLIAYDLATADEYVRKLGALNGVVYVTLEQRGKKLVSIGEFPASAPPPDQAVDKVNDGVYDVVHKLEVEGQTLGLLRFGFSLEQLYSVTSQAKAQLYLIALFELMLVGLCSWLLARYLTNRILLLQNASDKLQSGVAVEPIPVDGRDEISATIRAFNQMSTALIEREQTLRLTNKELEKASQAKSRFLSYMSHEIRSPMNAVLGSLALIRERGNFQKSEQYYLDLARDSGDALLQVVNEVLDFSKIEAGHVQVRQQPCSLRDLVRAVQSAILATGVKPKIGLYAEFEDAIPSFIGTDGERLRQILTILVDNAYKFTEEGQITVSASEVEALPGASHRRLRLVVKDTGPGVPHELVDTIFSEFEQTDATRDSGYGGIGLGLAIAKRLVTGLGGKIWLESEVDVGSAFTFEIPFDVVDKLPSEDMSSDPADRPDLEEGAAGSSGLKILLVDDVEANLIIGAALLRNRGYIVDVAHDGKDALKQAEKTDYSVILMDIRMPELNGLDATQRIRTSGRRNSKTPIIALTANAERSEIERCFQIGMNDFVSKPFTIERLSQSIEKCLSEHTQEEQQMQSNTESHQNPLVLSEDVLEQLIKDTSAENLPMMISVFMNEIKKRLEGLEKAEASSDELEIREQAHALKSSSGTFGGLRLQTAAKELEELASHSSACSDGDAITKLKQVAEETLVAYADYRERLKASRAIVE
ncbi:response regulator [Allohahella sp. A8]|uniref:response regulator n=1 Tax=Allohahella sp. A8 TaxID=3141461 RepID=UPI003A812EA2